MKAKLLLIPLPYIALLVANIIWGATPVVAKLSIREIPVLTIGFLRFFLAYLLLIPFLVTASPKAHTRFSTAIFKFKLKDLPKIVLAGIMMVSLHIFFFLEGVKRTTAIDASTLSLFIPILTALISWLIFRHKLYWINVIGISLGLIGSMIVVGLPMLFTGSLTYDQLAGNLLIIASGITFIIGAYTTKSLLKSYSPLSLISWNFLIGALSFLPFAIIDYLTSPNWYLNVTLVGIVGIIFMTILSSISAYFLFEWGVKKVGVVKSDLFQYISPAVSASIAVPLLGERISFSFIIGTCLIILGVYWGTLGRTEHSRHLHSHRV